jgi:hypothetical protein
MQRSLYHSCYSEVHIALKLDFMKWQTIAPIGYNHMNCAGYLKQVLRSSGSILNCEKCSLILVSSYTFKSTLSTVASCGLVDPDCSHSASLGPLMLLQRASPTREPCAVFCTQPKHPSLSASVTSALGRPVPRTVPSTSYLMHERDCY